MCMEYVSATIEACRVVTELPLRPAGCELRDGCPSEYLMERAYLVPFDLLEVEMSDDGCRMLPAFRAVVRVNALGTEPEEGKESDSPVNRGDTLMFRLNLTHYTDDPKDRLTEAVGMFEVSLDPKKTRLCTACVNFLDIVRTADIPPMILPQGEDGEYVLKLFVRRKKSDDERLEDFRDGDHDFVLRSMAKLHFWTKAEIEDELRRPDCRVVRNEIPVSRSGMECV